MRIVCLLVIGCALGCGKAAKTSSSSCRAVATCEDYTAETSSFLDGKANECKTTRGTWSTAACPTEGVAGSCREATAKWTRTRHYYGEVDLARTKIECGAFGTWLEPAR